MFEKFSSFIVKPLVDFGTSVVNGIIENVVADFHHKLSGEPNAQAAGKYVEAVTIEVWNRIGLSCGKSMSDLELIKPLINVLLTRQLVLSHIEYWGENQLNISCVAHKICDDFINFPTKLSLTKDVSPDDLKKYLSEKVAPSIMECIDNAIQIAIEDPEQTRLLHQRIQNGDKFATVLEAIWRGANVNAQLSSGRNALQVAIHLYSDSNNNEYKKKMLIIIESLLKSKADPNLMEYTSYWGMAPLHVVAHDGCKEVADLLLKHRAKIDLEGEHGFAKRWGGYTALNVARHKRHADVVSLLESYQGQQNKANAQGDNPHTIFNSKPPILQPKASQTPFVVPHQPR